VSCKVVKEFLQRENASIPTPVVRLKNEGRLFPEKELYAIVN
jgi:hypothetical protein